MTYFNLTPQSQNVMLDLTPVLPELTVPFTINGRDQRKLHFQFIGGLLYLNITDIQEIVWESFASWVDEQARFVAASHAVKGCWVRHWLATEFMIQYLPKHVSDQICWTIDNYDFEF